MTQLNLCVRFEDKRLGSVDIARQDGSVTWLHQVHGAQVVVVDQIGAHVADSADAAVTNVVGAKLLIRSADCAPVLFVGERDGHVCCIGVAHAGWKGLLAGVLPATAGALRRLGATEIRATLYPCIGPECYEFGEQDLDAVVASLGNSVRSKTAAGTVALDLIEAVRCSLNTAGVDALDTSLWSCTSCDESRFFSYRTRREQGRLGLFAWLETARP